MRRENPFSAWKLVLLVCFVYLHNVLSHPLDEDVKTKDFLIDKIKICPTVYVIGNSSYVNNTCNELHYPRTFVKENINIPLCMLVYDTTSKICEYSSKLPSTSSAPHLLPETVQELDQNIKKFERANDNPDICKNISSIFNKLNHSKVEGIKDINPYLDFAQKTLLTKSQCNYTCHSFDGSKINHLCTYLLWANEFFNSLKPIKDENDQGVDTKSHPIEKAVPQQKSSNKNEKQGDAFTDKKEEVKKTLSNPDVISESENPQIKQKLPDISKKSDDVPKPAVDPVNISNNEPVNKPSDQQQSENLNNQGSIQAPPKEEDAADQKELKKSEGEVDNPHHSPQEDANLDADSISAEDHQIKNENEDPEEANNRENADNDQKESNNQDIETPVKNPDENDDFQNGQKYMPHQTSKGDEESHFFTYLSIFSLLCILLYFGYHNKQKIFAILLEGRRSRRGRGSRRRPSTASYRKLDCNLEEAVTSQCNSNVTHVIY